MDTSRRTVVLVAIVGFLVGASGVAIAVHITGTVAIDNGVTVVAPDGMAVTIDGSTQLKTDDPFILSGTVEVVTEAGNMTVYSPGSAALTVHKDEIVAPWTNVTAVDADPNKIQVDPADKKKFDLAQEIDAFSYPGSPAIDDGTVDFVYEGTSGVSEVTIRGVTPDKEIVAVDASTGNFLDVATSSSSGAITFDALTNSKHAVLLQSTDFTDPILENPNPSGDQSSDPGTIEVDVKDPDFDNADSVTVTIDLDGSQIHQETITQNQTVSTSMPSSGKTGGQHDWTVDASDTYGDGTIETYSYKVPDTLYIRNELNHTEIIDAPISSNVTFFGEPDIITRSTSSGTIGMTGLPVNQEFIAGVEPTNDNWTDRALRVDNIYEQQDVYLLNTTAVSTVESRFVLNDPTGQYDSESILYVQRPINVSGTTTWQTVHSDAFGAEGVTTTLEEGQRYRIKVSNNGDDEQIIGPYRADVSETVEVKPGTPRIELSDFEDGWAADAVLNNDTLSYRYNDQRNETDKLTVWIHERGNASNSLVANATYVNVGDVSAKHTLTADEKEKTWVVEFIIDRNDEEFTHVISTSNRFDLFGGLADGWRLAIGIGSLVMFAGAFSLLNAALGAFVVAFLGGLWYWIGLLDGATMGFAVVLGMVIATINWMRQGGRG